eukprot:4760891-Prorocentrum_lima.AAC.1
MCRGAVPFFCRSDQEVQKGIDAGRNVRLLCQVQSHLEILEVRVTFSRAVMTPCPDHQIRYLHSREDWAVIRVGE